MKTSVRNDNSALTRIDALMIVVIVVLSAAFLLPFFNHNHSHSHAGRIRCVNNLKQIGLSFRIYAGDNNDKYPMNVSTNNKPLIIETTPVYRYFQSLSNELGTPKILICFDDEKRNAANDFAGLSNSNVSYFVGLDATENLTNSILSGDRNITNGFAPNQGLLNLTTNQMVRFTDEIHKKQGNIALGDGSVQQVSSARLRSEIIPNTGFATNRILLP